MQLGTKFLTFVKLKSWNCSKLKTFLTLRWTRIILKKMANSHNLQSPLKILLRLSLSPASQPAAYSPSKEIFWSGWKIPLQSKHIWLRMWRHLPTFKGLPNIKALPSLSLSLFSISLLEHNTKRFESASYKEKWTQNMPGSQNKKRINEWQTIPHICQRHHRRCLCKRELPGVNFYRFNAKIGNLLC